jgi:hypothetical protein
VGDALKDIWKRCSINSYEDFAMAPLQVSRNADSRPHDRAGTMSYG